MGQPRAGKRVVVISSDEEDSNDVADALIDDGDTNTPGEPRAKSRTAESRSALSVLPKPKVEPSPTPSPMSQKTKSKSQPAKAPSNKGKGSIYSFFNTATQKQQSSQQSSSSQRPQLPKPTEDIDDAIDEDDHRITLVQGSSTALAHRKRKLKSNDQGHHTSESLGAPASTQKFRKVSDETKVPVSNHDQDTRPWTEQYAPVDLSELCVNKKKVNDVRGLLETALSQRARPRLLVLKGSAGTGKTTTVRLLANDLGVDVKEWRNPTGFDGGSESSMSASGQFEDFILRGAKFAGLDIISSNVTEVPRLSQDGPQHKNGSDDKSQIILVEEFPNTFAKSSTTLQAFRSTIQSYLSVRSSPGQKAAPIVMIISETLLSTNTASADSFTAHRLLGPDILSHPMTVEIEFNDVATTFLTKALELIVVKEARRSGRRKTPGPQVLKHLAETGDVRSAVSSLEFLCLRGDGDDKMWSSKVAFTKPKGKATNREAPMTQQEHEALKLISNRQSTLGIFHSVGKVVYNKRQNPNAAGLPQEPCQPPSHMPEHRRANVPETDADALLTELGTDTSTFVAALHENYVLSCAGSITEETMDSVNDCIDNLSIADLLAPDRFGSSGKTHSGSALDSLRQDDMAFQVAVRGLLFSLPYPVKREASPSNAKRGDAYKMFYPTSLGLWKKQEEMESLLETAVSEYASSTGTASRAQRVKGDGVEGWRRNADATTDDDSNERSEDGMAAKLSLFSSVAKVEMLLERLPFMAKISQRSKTSTSSRLAENIDKLTSFAGMGLVSTEDEAGDAEDEAVDTAVSEWTDRPDADGEDIGFGSSKVKRSKASSKGAAKMEMEGGGLHIPVEHDVARLVLSDDDIED